MNLIVIRESKPHDLPNISDVVRNAYISNIYNSWLNVALSEVSKNSLENANIVLHILFFR